MKSKLPSFWHWFFGGDLVCRPGWKKIVCNRWFFFHIAIGFIGAFLLRGQSASAIAEGSIIPMAMIFVGLCFSWSGQAASLLGNEKLKSFFDKHPDGPMNYIYTYQMGLLLLLVTVIYWGVMALTPEKLPCVVGDALKMVGVALFSVSVRECWALSLGISYMLGIKLKENGEDKKDGV